MSLTNFTFIIELSNSLLWKLEIGPKRHAPVGVGPEEGHKKDQRAGTPLV